MKNLIVDDETAYSLALNNAEQGGLFSSIRFREMYPNAQAYKNRKTLTPLKGDDETQLP